MRFLVSGAGGDIGQSISRILSSYYQDSEVLGSDIHAEFLTGDLFARTVILPRASSPDYINGLSDVIDKEDIDVFIPASEPELRWFVEHRDVWKSLSCHCLMASSMAMKIGFDKLLTVQHLQKSGLPSPWAFVASDSESGAPELPCILKSRFGAGSSSVYLIDDQDKSLPEASKNILCEPISPEEYKLQHRKSVHEYFNPELLQNSASKVISRESSQE